MPHTKDFKKILGSVKHTYLGKPVKAMYQNKYGKRYDSKEVKSVAYAIARSRGIATDLKSYSRRIK